MKKTVIITGASSGIGAATAILLSKNNFNIVLAARRKNKLESIAEKLEGEYLIVETDVCKVDDVENLVNKTIEKFGTLNVLVNNAGIGNIAPLGEGKLEDWHNMFNINVNGLLTCIHKALPHLLKQKGNIINIASVAAHEVFPNAVVYSATKHAVNAITVGLRKEYRDNLKVCNISPGTVHTEFFENSQKKTVDEMRDYFKNNQALEGEDIAEVIFQVLSKPERVAVNEIIIRPNA